MELEDYIQNLIQKEVLPGISVLVGQEGSIVFKDHWGWQALFPEKEPIRPDTLYDVASLTKPLITALLVLHLVETGTLKLETKVKDIFPELSGYGEMNIVHLLTHTSGLPGWFPLYLFGDEFIGTFPLISLKGRPGSRMQYSCPGYILLYYIVEKVSGESFRQLAQKVIIDRLDLKHSYLSVPENLRETAAPTEHGNGYVRELTREWARKYDGGSCWDAFQRFHWREDIIRGEAHDLYSYHLGGTAGNAGLFSTTDDIYKLSLEFYPDTATVLKAESIEGCWENKTPYKKSHRTLGFKKNSSFIATGGRAFSRRAIGHNGFTGASIWLDRWHKSNRDTTVIMLSNLVHPVVPSTGFDRIRKKLNRLLCQKVFEN